MDEVYINVNEKKLDTWKEVEYTKYDTLAIK